MEDLLTGNGRFTRFNLLGMEDLLTGNGRFTRFKHHAVTTKLVFKSFSAFIPQIKVFIEDISGFIVQKILDSMIV